MENKKTGKRLNVLVVILIIILLCLIGYIVYDKVITKDSSVATKTDTKEETKKEDSTKESARELTQTELNLFKLYFSQDGVNGFLSTTYSDVKDINPYALFYMGIGNNFSYVSDSWSTNHWSDLTIQEQNDYTSTYQYIDDGDYDVMRTSDINKFLNTYAGISLTDLTKPLSTMKDYEYLEKYDTYYHWHSDGLLTEINSCTSGKIDKDGYYIVDCDNLEVKLKENNGKYQFVSNTCVEDCDGYSLIDNYGTSNN